MSELSTGIIRRRAGYGTFRLWNVDNSERIRRRPRDFMKWPEKAGWIDKNGAETGMIAAKNKV